MLQTKMRQIKVVLRYIGSSWLW